MHGPAGDQGIINLRPAPRRRLLLLFFPVVVSFCGVVFSWDISVPAMRALVVFLSLLPPALASGSYLARYRTTWAERAFFICLCFALTGLAIASVAGLPESIEGRWSSLTRLTEFSQRIGVISLLLGVAGVIFLSLRSQYDIDALGERFRQLADHIDEGLVLCDGESRIQVINQRLLDMLGVGEEELRGEYLDYFTRLASDGPVKKRPRGEGSRAPIEYEFGMIVNREERRFAFSDMTIHNLRGTVTGSLTTVRDITAHHKLAKRVERYAQGLQRLVEEQTQKLHRYEDRYRRLLLSMNEGFLTLDASNCVRLANGSACRLLRLDVEELRGRSIFDFIEGPGRMRLLNILARGDEVQGAEARLELDFVTPKGTIPSMVSVSFVGDDSESEWESVFSMVVTNVSEIKQMHQQADLRAHELERVNEELRMHGRAKDGFLSNVTHELRTPLATISGYIEMLHTGGLGAVEPAQEGALKVMRRNAERLEGLINELIEFSRMEIQGVQLRKRLFSPERLARETAASVHPHALEKKITVRTIIGEGVPSYAWGDRDRLGQVLGILLNNAVKFTGSEGHIDLNVAIADGDTVVIAVTDTGIGVDSIHQDQIFKKFFQVDSSKTRRFEGTGIGLSIASSIVRAHDGDIEVRSRLGEGSTFTVSLPDAFFKTAHDPESIGDFANLRLVVVNEELSFTETVCAFLASHVQELHAEANAYNCIRMAEEKRPDLIIVNDSKIDDDAVQFIHRLRQQEATSGIPVIVFCGELRSEYRELATISDGLYFILRPFDIFIVLDRIRAAVFGETAGLTPISETQSGGHDGNPHILIVDADPGFLEWVETCLHLRGMPCCCAPNVPKAHEMIGQSPPDAVFLDGDLPLASVREQLALLTGTEVTADAPVFLMTGTPGGLETIPGAAGILRKPFGADEMVSLIESARKGRGEVSSNASSGDES